MAINKIEKLQLESKAVSLREKGNTFDEIAKRLTEDSKQPITKSTVFRFFESYEKTKAELLERQEALKVKYVEADISTIEDRQKVIKGLLAIATSAMEDRDRVAAYKEANVALESLDKRLGKIINNPSVTINNTNSMKLSDVSTLSDEQLIEIINSG